MRIAREILETAMLLSGMEDAESVFLGEADFYRKGLYLVNQALSEIGVERVENLDSPVSLTAEQADAVHYAAARMIAVLLHNSEAVEVLSGLYDQKRAKAFSQSGQRINRIPTAYR